MTINSYKTAHPDKNLEDSLNETFSNFFERFHLLKSDVSVEFKAKIDLKRIAKSLNQEINIDNLEKRKEFIYSLFQKNGFEIKDLEITKEHIIINFV
jgi:predicted  nucleic acid-binding Zn-ribbon protein